MDFDDSIDEFLRAYPEMRLAPSSEGTQKLIGIFRFTATTTNLPTITDAFKVSIHLKDSLRRSLPQVLEVGGRIPQFANNHVNPDLSLCLGSPLRQRLVIGPSPTLRGFAEQCLVPFLYSRVLYEKKLADYPFGELAHGRQGLIDDYINMFKVDSEQQLQALLDLLAMERKVANKKLCPCGCGQRFARCSLHTRTLFARSKFSQAEIKLAREELW